jgi:trimeric autotransporter adhesin
MKTKIQSLFIALAMFAGVHQTFAQVTAFTYQGRLNDGTNLANGTYDLQFAIYDAASAGTQQGNLLTNSATTVSNGLFTVTLDFGNQFHGANRWLEIAVRTNGGGAFSVLIPRQELTPTPYAVTAANVTGIVPNTGLSGTYSGTILFNNAGNVFAGNGSGLANLNANSLNVGSVPPAALGNAWKTTGNAGTSPGANFIGTTDNQPLELHVNGARVFRMQPITNGAPTIIGGSSSNSVDPTVRGATIGGGDYNSIQFLSDYSIISGGYSNQILYASFDSTIGGGLQNILAPNVQYSTIAGGQQNSIDNTVFASSIGGGMQNDVQTFVQLSTIAGGYQNQMQQLASYSSIGGGRNNIIQTNVAYSALGGGWDNTIAANYSSIGSGWFNTIATNADYSAIPGGSFNLVQSAYSAIGGGYNNTISSNGNYDVIGGGTANIIQTNAGYSIIGGGLFNQIQADAQFSFIGGGDNNHDMTNATYAVMGGGSNNTIESNAQYASIVGGQLNTISSSAHFSTIGGGKANVISTLAQYATIPGGGGNLVGGNLSFAAGEYAQALNNQSFVWNDGSAGTFQSTADNQFSVHAVGGIVLAGDVSIAGGSAYQHLSLSGGNSTGFLYGSYPALGDGIHMGYNWYADATGAGHVINTGGGTSRISAKYGEIQLATGGVDAVPNVVLDVTTAGVTISGNFSYTSDRNAKQDFAPVSPSQILDKVLQLPMSEWSYKVDAATRHLGPMAQDFYAAFNLGTDDKHIAPVDEGGVALAAIQALNQKLNEKDGEIQTLKQQNDSLAERLNELETTVKQLAQK